VNELRVNANIMIIKKQYKILKKHQEIRLSGCGYQNIRIRKLANVLIPRYPDSLVSLFQGGIYAKR
jgi:hypothetical protein